MAMFYGMINIAVVNALVIYAHNMRKAEPENCTWSGDTICKTTIHTCFTNWERQTAIVMCGFVSDSEENTMEDPEDYEAISRKRGRRHVCSRSRDVKTQFVAKDVDITSAKTICIWLLLVTLARIRMKLVNLISCFVFPTLLLLLQIILWYLHSWIQNGYWR